MISWTGPLTRCQAIVKGIENRRPRIRASDKVLLQSFLLDSVCELPARFESNSNHKTTMTRHHCRPRRPCNSRGGIASTICRCDLTHSTVSSSPIPALKPCMSSTLFARNTVVWTEAVTVCTLPSHCPSTVTTIYT